MNSVSFSSSGTVAYSTPTPSPSPSPTPTPTPTPNPKGELYIIFGGWLIDSNGNPNAIAQRIANAKVKYGRPEWVEVGNWGALHWTPALINYFHSVGIKCSCRIWSGGTINNLHPLDTLLHDMNPANGYGGSVDYQMTYGSGIDAFMIDEANFWSYPDYYAALRDYIHSFGKMVFMNPGSWNMAESHATLADVISTEFCWYKFGNVHQDLISQYPEKFLGSSTDWGYANLPSEVLRPVTDEPTYSAPMSLERAVSDTMWAWSHGIYYFEAKQQTESLPSWWEDYLSQLS